MDGRGVGLLVVSVVDAEVSEDVKGVLPVSARVLEPAEGVVGMSEPVVGAGLVHGLTEVARYGQRQLVVDDGCIGVAGGEVEPAEAVLGLATGSSPTGIYASLAARVAAGELDFGRASGFALDEYVGIPLEHPESYASVIERDA